MDPDTGAPTWDSNASYGTFLMSVSAAALHSSGRVVAVHTDSGRFGVAQPGEHAARRRWRPTARARGAQPLQVGLLGSPIAIAVTNPGVVIVLEASGQHGPQLAAFDLNGNPVPLLSAAGDPTSAGPRRPLAPAGQGNYTLPWSPSGTYLDLAVDGSGQIYVLYYTGAGTSARRLPRRRLHPDRDRPGHPQPGVNVPHLAIDYWRSIYAANYDPLTDIGTTKPHIDPALGVVEPSLSRFDPVEVIALGKPPKKHQTQTQAQAHAQTHQTKHK